MTDNPLFDTILASGDITKSKVLTELKKRQAQSGYSCDMIIIDDVIAPPPTPEQKASMLRLYQDHLDSKILSAFRIPERAVKAGVANTANLQSKLVAKKLDEELREKFGIRHANSEPELQKMWGRNY